MRLSFFVYFLGTLAISCLGYRPRTKDTIREAVREMVRALSDMKKQHNKATNPITCRFLRGGCISVTEGYLDPRDDPKMVHVLADKSVDFTVNKVLNKLVLDGFDNERNLVEESMDQGLREVLKATMRDAVVTKKDLADDEEEQKPKKVVAKHVAYDAEDEAADDTKNGADYDVGDKEDDDTGDEPAVEDAYIRTADEAEDRALESAVNRAIDDSFIQTAQQLEENLDVTNENYTNELADNIANRTVDYFLNQKVNLPKEEALKYLSNRRRLIDFVRTMTRISDYINRKTAQVIKRSFRLDMKDFALLTVQNVKNEDVMRDDIHIYASRASRGLKDKIRQAVKNEAETELQYGIKNGITPSGKKQREVAIRDKARILNNLKDKVAAEYKQRIKECVKEILKNPALATHINSIKWPRRMNLAEFCSRHKIKPNYRAEESDISMNLNISEFNNLNYKNDINSITTRPHFNPKMTMKDVITEQNNAYEGIIEPEVTERGDYYEYDMRANTAGYNK